MQGVGHSPADDTSGDDGLIVRPVVSRGAGSGHSPADGSNSAGSTTVQSLIADGVGSGIVRLLSLVVLGVATVRLEVLGWCWREE